MKLITEDSSVTTNQISVDLNPQQDEYANMEKFLRKLHIPQDEINEIKLSGSFSADWLRSLHNSD